MPKPTEKRIDEIRDRLIRHGEMDAADGYDVFDWFEERSRMLQKRAESSEALNVTLDAALEAAIVELQQAETRHRQQVLADLIAALQSDECRFSWAEHGAQWLKNLMEKTA